MSKKTSSKKTTTIKSGPKSVSGKDLSKDLPKFTKAMAKKTHLTMAERADAAARAAEKLEASDLPAIEMKTMAFSGASLPPKKAKKTAAPKTEKEPRVTVTSVSEDLIRSGKTNEEILEALTKKFSDFDADKKRHYPQWYRARLVRSGVITEEFAEAHRHSSKE